jgi:hypothetical protein
MNQSESVVRPGRSWLAVVACLALVVAGAVGAVVLTGTTSARAAATGTHRVVLRPVTSSGHAVKGYRVVTDKRSVECDGTSPVAVNGGIAYCGSSADTTLACWASASRGRLLCLTDPFVHTLRSLRLSGAFPAVRAPRHARPQALLLANGGKYLVRNGGAWGTVKQHPSWVGYYFERASFTHEVYGPRHGDGINRRHARWFVTTYRHESGHGTRHDVARAYYVGTAG